MKNIFLILLSALALCSCAAERAYWRTDPVAAQKEAADENKPLLVLMSAPDCSACESNWMRIFCRQDFLSEASRSCVPLFVSCPYKEPSSLCKEWREKYDAEPSPSLFIIESDGSFKGTVPFPYGDSEKCLNSIKTLLAE